MTTGAGDRAPQLPGVGALPDGYACETDPRGRLARLQSAAALLDAAGFGLQGDGTARPGERVGRRPMPELYAGGRGFLLRRFAHGGIARRLTGERFADPARPFRELCVSERLRAAGVRTPRVVAARALRARPFGWRLAVLTELVEDGQDLGAWLARVRRAEVGRGQLRAALRLAGRTVGGLHERGLWHADLNPNNLLLRGGLSAPEAELWVLDLDRAELRETLTEGARVQNLARLLRHVRRRDARAGAALARSDYARFLKAYDPTPGSWKRRWRAVEAALARGSLAHRLGRLLDRWLAPQSDPRGGS